MGNIYLHFILITDSHRFVITCPFFASGHVQKAPVAKYLHAFPTHLLQNGIRIVSISLRQNLGKRAPDICHGNVVDHRDK